MHANSLSSSTALCMRRTELMFMQILWQQPGLTTARGGMHRFCYAFLGRSIFALC